MTHRQLERLKEDALVRAFLLCVCRGRRAQLRVLGDGLVHFSEEEIHIFFLRWHKHILEQDVPEEIGDALRRISPHPIYGKSDGIERFIAKIPYWLYMLKGPHEPWIGLSLSNCACCFERASRKAFAEGVLTGDVIRALTDPQAMPNLQL